MKRSVPMRAVSISRRLRAARVLAAAAVAAMAGSAFAQAWPAKPVRLILPYGPGGGSDVVARPLGHFLSQRLGQQFLVDNRGGASGMIATLPLLTSRILKRRGWMSSSSNSSRTISSLLIGTKFSRR